MISGDGDHGNPEVEALDMIKAARGNEKYTLHFTFTQDAFKTESSAKRKKALKKVDEWVKTKPENCDVVFREKGKDKLSVMVDLLDPYFPEDE